MGIAGGPIHMGSTAIPEMPGTPVVDMALQLSEFPPTQEVIEKLTGLGFSYPKQAPHAHDDYWSFGGEGKKGHLGRVNIHMVSRRTKFLEDARAFVDFCSVDKQAFDAYREVKIQGMHLARQGSRQSGMSSHMQYKACKARVVADVMAKALKWRGF